MTLRAARSVLVQVTVSPWLMVSSVGLKPKLLKPKPKVKPKAKYLYQLLEKKQKNWQKKRMTKLQKEPKRQLL